MGRSRKEKKHKPRRRIIWHATCFKLTTENWSGSYQLKEHDAQYDIEGEPAMLLTVSFLEWDFEIPHKSGVVARTCVWGTDDTGMDFNTKTVQEAKDMFFTVCELPYLERYTLEELGFINA